MTFAEGKVNDFSFLNQIFQGKKKNNNQWKSNSEIGQVMWAKSRACCDTVTVKRTRGLCFPSIDTSISLCLIKNK